MIEKAFYKVWVFLAKLFYSTFKSKPDVQHFETDIVTKFVIDNKLIDVVTNKQIRRVQKFLALLPSKIVKPQITINSFNELELFWNFETLYVDVTFENNGVLSSFYKNKVFGNEHFAEYQYDSYFIKGTAPYKYLVKASLIHEKRNNVKERQRSE